MTNESILINNRYKIIEKLSQGAFGQLYKSEDLQDDKKVKTIREYNLKPNEDIEVAKSNMITIQQFINPYLVQYFDSYHDKELKNYYVVMDNYEDTKTLEFILDECQKEKTPLQNEQIQFWSIQILKGLDFLHKNEIIHRNIKPMNILVRDDNIILGELGLERDPNVMMEQHVEAGIGTLNYMAPEIAKNYINYTKKIDIWSFGTVLYEMINLKRLVDGRKPQIISYLINFKDHKLKLENMFPLFLTLLKKCLLLLPETRSTTSYLLENLLRNFNIPAQGFKRIKKNKIVPMPPVPPTTTSKPQTKQRIKSPSPPPPPLEPPVVKSPILSRISTPPMSASRTRPMVTVSPSPTSQQSKTDSLTDIRIIKEIDEADNLFKLSNYTDALEHYNRVIQMKSDHADAHFKKARCLRGLLKYEESIKVFDEAIKLDPNNLSAYNYKAFSLKAIGKNKEANDLFEEALHRNVNPQDAIGYFNQALSLHGLKKFEEAISFYNKSIDVDPNDAFTYNSKGILLKALNRFNEAIECYNKAINLEPNYAYAYNNKGLLLYSINKNSEAIDCFDQAIKLYKDYADAYKNKGNALFELKKYDEAIQTYSKALELDPKCANTYNNKGNTYSFMNRFREAIDCYDKVIELEPNSVDAFKNKAILFKEMNMTNEALYCYECILKIQPNNPNALENKKILLDIMK